jgi:hypothetical protein
MSMKYEYEIWVWNMSMKYEYEILPDITSRICSTWKMNPR